MALFQWAKVFACGICMGAADVVPGISGGTMAFILGIYEKLLWSVKSINLESLKLFFTGRWREFSHKVSFWFLFTLILGILFAVVSLANVIEYSLNHETYRTYLYSLFLGLVIASAWLVSKKIEIWHMRLVLTFILGFLCAFAITSLPLNFDSEEAQYRLSIELPYPSEGIQNYNNGQLLDLSKSTLSAMLAKEVITQEALVEDKTGKIQPVGTILEAKHGSVVNPYIIMCGAIAISAMLLPGISGSYFLVILGAYPLAISAVSDTVKSFSQMSLDVDAVLLLVNLIVGILIGAAAFSRVISWCLHHHHNETISTLMGFMLGALPAIWPYCTYESYLIPLKLSKGPQLKVAHLALPALDVEFFISLLWIAAGLIIVIGIHALAQRKKHVSQ